MINTANGVNSYNEPSKNKLLKWINNEMFSKKNVKNFHVTKLFGGGISKDGKTTIIAKAFGFDKNISKNEANELIEFLQNTKIANLGMVENEETKNLLYSAELSVAEFKEKWLEYAKKSNIKSETKQENKDIAELNAEILEEKQEKFKAIQGESQNKQTYDINKDAKFKYLQKKLEFKQRDVEILDLMQELQKKYGVDKRV